MSYPASYPTPPARQANGLARGAAIAALVYFGIIFVALAAVIVFGGSILASIVRDLSEYEDQSISSGTLIGVLMVALVFIFAFPIGISVWMLVGARRNRPGHVLAPLIIFSFFTLIGLLGSVGGGSGNSGSGLLAANLPWYAILVVGWVGWARMNKAGEQRSGYGNQAAAGGYAGSGLMGYPPPGGGGWPYPPGTQNPGYPNGQHPYGQGPSRQNPHRHAQQPVQSNAGRPGGEYGSPADRGARYEQAEPTRRLPPPEAWPPPQDNWSGSEPASRQPTSSQDYPESGRSSWAGDYSRTDSSQSWQDQSPQPWDASEPLDHRSPSADEPTRVQRSPWARPDHDGPSGPPPAHR